jgi:hypothetical protein
MSGKISEHVRSNAVGYLALFVALGGTSYAATLPRNSVGNKQLKTNAVTSAKIRNGGVRSQDLAPGVVRRGQRGPEGPAGPSGAISGTLPSGATVRGRFEATSGSPNNAQNDTIGDSISFGAQLPAAPTRAIVAPGATTAQCTGTVAEPKAAPGYLCIYVSESFKAGTIDTIGDGATVGATSRQGTGIIVVSNQPGSFGARGSWAVTAP